MSRIYNSVQKNSFDHKKSIATQRAPFGNSHDFTTLDSTFCPVSHLYFIIVWIKWNIIKEIKLSFGTSQDRWNWIQIMQETKHYLSFETHHEPGKFTSETGCRNERSCMMYIHCITLLKTIGKNIWSNFCVHAEWSSFVCFFVCVFVETGLLRFGIVAQLLCCECCHVLVWGAFFLLLKSLWMSFLVICWLHQIRLFLMSIKNITN